MSGREQRVRGDVVPAIAADNPRIAPAASVVPIPEGVSLEEAATLPMNGLTAMQSLELLGLDAGQTLVVTGGAGHLG